MKRPDPTRSAVWLALILTSATVAAQTGAPVVEPAAPAGGAATNPYLANRAAPATAEDPMERLNRNLLEMLNRQERLEQELRQLRGDIEMVTHQLDGVKQRQRELYLDVDRRLRELELRGVASPAAPAPAGGAAGAAVATGTAAAAAGATASGAAPSAAAAGTPAAGQPGAGEREAYRRAFDLLKEGQYERAIDAFRGFLQSYPAGSYSDNAQYWLGEANYVSRSYPQALEEFAKVLEQFPDSPKVPDAMLKTGFTHYELGQYDQARKILQELIQRYPKSTAARLAETRLERMRREGR